MSNFSTKITLATLSLCLFALTSGSLTSTAHAQTTLQGAQSGLQQQTGQAQQSANTQNQTGTVQNTNQSSLLDQKTGVNLGVVSSPSQSSPDVVVSPSNSLTTEISQNKRASKKPFIIAVSLLIVIIGIVALRTTQNTPQTNPQETKPTIKPEPLKTPKKSRKSTRRQRKKTSQR